MRDFLEDVDRHGEMPRRFKPLTGQLGRIGDRAADVNAGLDGLECRLLRLEAEALLLALPSVPLARDDS